MRLNFQQQKPINLSAGGPSFVPDQSREADQEANIRLQMINEQQQALKDMAQAAVMIAKANQQAKEAEQQSDLADARLKINKIKEDIEFGVEMNQNTTLSYIGRDETQEDTSLNKDKSGYFKVSRMQEHQERTTEWLKKNLVSDYEAEGDDKFTRALEREVDYAMGNAFGNAKKSAVRHTKNALSVSLVKENEEFARKLEKLNDINEIQRSIQKRHAEIPNQLQGTFLPEEIEAKQAKFIENSITQLAFKLSDPNSSDKDHALYKDLYQKAMKGEGVFKNSNPLFWMRLHRDAGQRIFNIERSDQLANAKLAVQYDPEKFLVVAGMGINSKEVDGEIKIKYSPKKLSNGKVDQNWERHFQKISPLLDKKDLVPLFNKAVTDLEKKANDALKKTQFKGAKKDLFQRKVVQYFGFWKTTWAPDSQGLKRTTIDPPPPPWNKTTFKGAEWENYKANLIEMEQIYMDADEAYKYSLIPQSSPEKIDEKLDEIYDRIQTMPVYSEGLRMEAMSFYMQIQPMFKKEEFKAGNTSVKGKNNTNRRADFEARSPKEENLIGDQMKFWVKPR